jgi:hypothetical protein
MALTLNGSTGVTFNDSSLQGAAASPYVLKNRIINGDMGIDQRNAGASYAQINNQYNLDRWKGFSYAGSAVTGKYTVQQNAGAVTSPVGFVNYLGVTSSATTADAATNIFGVAQSIEGLNMADFGWGTANAVTVTVSFWVRSSLTGTFGGAIQNSAANRSYPFTYTISSANTWEQKSVTIAGDTSGTWLTTNGLGLQIIFGFGVGSTYSASAGSWAAGNYYSATGATSVVGTNGATFYITGVQLEQNTSATPFERRLYNQELANCQRYYNRWSGANCPSIGIAQAVATGSNAPVARRFSWANPVDFRAQPTMGYGGSLQIYTAGLSNLVFTAYNGTTSNKNIISFDANSTSSGTSGQSVMLIIDSASAANYFDASAEL